MQLQSPSDVTRVSQSVEEARFVFSSWVTTICEFGMPEPVKVASGVASTSPAVGDATSSGWTSEAVLRSVGTSSTCAVSLAWPR